MKRKTLKELTLKDNFMFGAVMCEEDNCKRFLELVLGFTIAYVEVSKEKSIVYHPVLFLFVILIRLVRENIDIRSENSVRKIQTLNWKME